MPLPPLVGHHEARQRLARAVAADAVPQSILLHGAAGIGKERLGLWLAERLFCEVTGDGEPCGACRGCRLVTRLEHPDVHWFFPLPRPEGASPEKLKEKLEEARGAELQAWREDPFHVPHFDRAPAYFLATMRRVQELAATRPSLGSRKVFVFGDAETMVPQEASPEAANAFLKLLEEPPGDTTLVLTSSAPGALLPTIRSRVLPIRVVPAARSEVAAFLVRHRGVEEGEAGAIAAAAGGALGRALRLLPSRGGASPLAARHAAARAWLMAALAPSPAERLGAAQREAPAGGRGEFTGQLEALAVWLRDLAAAAAGADDAVLLRDEREVLSRVVRERRLHPLAAARAIRHVQDALDLAAGNVNPQLVLASLLRQLSRELHASEV